MSKKQQPMMRSLADMPKIVIALEAIGILLLLVVFLAMNDYLTLPEVLQTQTAFISMVMIAIGCLIPAAINIVWRAIHGLSFLGIDYKKRVSETKPQKESEKKRP